MSEVASAADPLNAKSQETAMFKRRWDVVELHLAGCSQMAIARRLNIAQGTVSKDLAFIHQEWEVTIPRDFKAARDLALAKIERIEREAWEAWDESRKPLITVDRSTEDAGQEETKKRRSRTRSKTQSGDTRHLLVVQKCVQQRAALLGLDATNLAKANGTYQTFEEKMAEVERAMGGPGRGVTF